MGPARSDGYPAPNLPAGSTQALVDISYPGFPVKILRTRRACRTGMGSYDQSTLGQRAARVFLVGRAGGGHQGGTDSAIGASEMEIPGALVTAK